MKIENTQRLADIVQSSGLRLFSDCHRYSMADEAREVASVTGSHYFSKDTLRFFNAKVYEGYILGNGLAYLFVESVLPPDNVRIYRACVMTLDGMVTRSAEFKTLKAARNDAQKVKNRLTVKTMAAVYARILADRAAAYKTEADIAVKAAQYLSNVQGANLSDFIN